MRYGLYKKTQFENFGNRAFCQRTAVLGSGAQMKALSASYNRLKFHVIKRDSFIFY